MANIKVVAQAGRSFLTGSTGGNTTPVGPVTANETTDALFVPNNLGQYIDYTKTADGTLSWAPHQLRLRMPSSSYARAVFVTVQKGAIVKGAWTPADDKEGASDSALYSGRLIYIAELDAATRGNTVDIPGTSMDASGAYPQNGAACRTFRYRVYVISTQSLTGGDASTTVVLQTAAFTGADHFDLTPDDHPTTLDGKLLGDTSVLAAAMARDSITAANGALAANAVVDNNIAGCGVAKLIYGTVIFGGDVYLSRGTGNPVMALTNGGLYLYGVANSAAGLTSAPYAAVTSVGIGLYAGISSRAITLQAGALTLWYVAGSLNDPYIQLQPTGISIVSGSYSLTATSSQIKLSYGPTVYTALTSAGLQIVSGSYSLTAYSTGISLSYGTTVSIAMSTLGITIGNANATMSLGTQPGYPNSAVFTYAGLSTVITGADLFTGTIHCTEIYIDPGMLHLPPGCRFTTAGTASGYYLAITVAGVTYKLQLLNN